MELWHAVVLGLVEGITEYLPISSTGHLILASSLMGLDTPEAKHAVDDFNIVIQGGAILAVLGLYWPRVVQMIKGVLGRDEKGLLLLINLGIAFLPAAVIGLLAHDYIEAKLFRPSPVLAAVLLGGLYMMTVEAWRDGKFSARRTEMSLGEVTDVTPRQALVVGLLQCIAMWPGVSRSMMTITGGYLIGLKPKAAAEFSFLLGLPTLGAATLYSLYKNLKHAHATGGQNLFEQLGYTSCAVGLAVACVSAALAVKWLVGFLNRRGLHPFGWYRVALFAVLGVLMWQGIVSI